MRIPFFLITVFFIGSCAVYNKNFDGPSPEVKNYGAVSEIEGMIRENDEGPDIFEGEEKTCRKKTVSSNNFKGRDMIVQEKKQEITPPKSCYTNERGETIFKKNESIRRVWIHGYVTSSGNYVEGRYVYFTLDDDDWVVLNEGAKKK